MTRNFLYLLLLIFSMTSLHAKTILVVGDSLSAAYNIDAKYGWVNLLNTRLKQQSEPYQVVNISTSGDTTSNGLTKLPAALSTYKPDIVIIELGANDGLRGLPVAEMQHNLAKMITQSEQKSAKVLLLATLIPPNYGPVYRKQFDQVYKDVATQYKLLLVPMFLQGVAGDKKYIQDDGLHPNQEAQQRILENIWPTLKSML